MKNFFVGGFAIVLGFVLFSARTSKHSEESGQMEFVSTAPPLEAESKRAPANDEAAKQKLWDEIQTTQSCYQTQKCDFPQVDPRSYEFAVSRALAEKVKQFHVQFKNDPSARVQLTQLARKMIKVEDGFVQSAALDIFHDLPVDAENLQAIGDGLHNNSDPLIAEKALGELQRYMNTPQETQMQSIVQGMVSGAHFSSQKVGENILGFINDRNFASYQQLYNQLPAQSRVARDLATALREYKRQRTGG